MSQKQSQKWIIQDTTNYKKEMYHLPSQPLSDTAVCGKKLNHWVSKNIEVLKPEQICTECKKSIYKRDSQCHH